MGAIIAALAKGAWVVVKAMAAVAKVVSAWVVVHPVASIIIGSALGVASYLFRDSPSVVERGLAEIGGGVALALITGGIFGPGIHEVAGWAIRMLRWLSPSTRVVDLPELRWWWQGGLELLRD